MAAGANQRRGAETAGGHDSAAQAMPTPPRPLERWALASVLVIVGAALLRLLTVQVAWPVFDVDPIVGPGAQPGVAPAFSLLLDALVLGACAVGLVVAARRQEGVRSWMVWLALLPVLALLVRVGQPIEHVWRGATWISGVTAGVVLAVLLRDGSLRRLALALLLGALAILAVRGLTQLAIEHPRLVESFSSSGSSFMAERGWAPDSASARVFEDRLRQREATGWFGLSNVFSSTMVVAALLAATCAWAGRRRGVVARWIVAPGLVATAAVLLVGINASKGALAALALGALVFAFGCSRLLSRRGDARAPGAHTARWPTWIIFGLPALALVAVILRGSLLPEGFAGERSLLFRWHYLVNALRVLGQHPFLGVGPDGFQQAMLGVREPHHAEEVASVHNVLMDWLVAWGIFGVAWIALLVTMLRWCAAALLRPWSEQPASVTVAEPPDATTRLAPLAILVVGVLSLWIESRALDPVLLVMRCAGVLAGVVTASAVNGVVCSARRRSMAMTVGDASSGPRRATRAPTTSRAGAAGRDDVPLADLPEPTAADVILRLGLFAAAVALVVQAQIEMTFWLQGALPAAMVMLALAGPAPDPRRTGPILARVPAPAVAATALLALAALACAVPAWRTERALRAAAAPLERVGLARLASMAALAPAANALPLMPAVIQAFHEADLPLETMASVHALLAQGGDVARDTARRTLDEALADAEAAARRSAIDRLSAATGGSDIRPVLALGEQSLRLAQLTPSVRHGLLDAALTQVAGAIDEPGRASMDLRLLRLEAALLEAQGAPSELDPPDQSAPTALQRWQEIAVLDPCSITVQRHIARCAAAAGDVPAQRAAAARALELDEALHLDPRRRLTPEERARLRAMATAPPG